MSSLRRIRVERLLTIRELAQRAGVAPSTIYLIEAGRSRPSLRVIRRLTSALAVEPRDVDEFRAALRLPEESAAGESEH